jgi:hypothetical protein
MKKKYGVGDGGNVGWNIDSWDRSFRFWHCMTAFDSKNSSVLLFVPLII